VTSEICPAIQKRLTSRGKANHLKATRSSHFDTFRYWKNSLLFSDRLIPSRPCCWSLSLDKDIWGDFLVKCSRQINEPAACLLLWPAYSRCPRRFSCELGLTCRAESITSWVVDVHVLAACLSGVVLRLTKTWSELIIVASETARTWDMKREFPYKCRLYVISASLCIAWAWKCKLKRNNKNHNNTVHILNN